MKTREEIMALWQDQEKCPDFEPVLQELLDEREKLLSQQKELVEECKRELARKDKRLSELESEVTRVFDPIRKFWNHDKDENVKLLKEELKRERETVNFYANWANTQDGKVTETDCEYIPVFEPLPHDAGGVLIGGKKARSTKLQRKLKDEDLE